MLRIKRHIIGTRPTLEDLLNPVAESKIGKSSYDFPGGDKEIVEEAKRRVSGVDEADIQEDADGEEDLEPSPPEISLSEGCELCEKLEQLCLQHAGADGIDTVALQGQLQQLRGHLRKVEFSSVKQTTLASLWSGP